MCQELDWYAVESIREEEGGKEGTETHLCGRRLKLNTVRVEIIIVVVSLAAVCIEQRSP